MLSTNAERLMWALRENVGPDRKGVGPETHELVELVDMEPAEILAAAKELREVGFINIERGMPTSHAPDRPKELRNIIGVTVLERMQVYCDEIEEPSE